MERTLRRLFQEIIQWRMALDEWEVDELGDLVQEEATLPWTESHLLTVRRYVSKLDIKSDFKVLSLAKNHSISKTFSANIIPNFIQGLQEFFSMKNLYQLLDEDDANYTPKKIELLAAFINFLHQLLHHKTVMTHSCDDQINDLKELRFLLTFLGDTSLMILLGDELEEEVNNVLEEFKDAADEAGWFVYSFIFAMDGLFIGRRAHKDLVVLLEHINLFKSSITIFSTHIRKANITPKTTSISSLFIVDSLINDLEGLINRDHDQIIDVKAQLNILHQTLLLSKSLLNGIRVPRLIEVEELKGILMQIIDVAYEAEYLIKTFLAGNNPPWYFTIRLLNVSRQIELIWTELRETKKSFDMGALKVAPDYRAEPSLLVRTHFEVEDITVGIEDKVTHILDPLVGGTKDLQVITIFGMPGLGKTTIAKKLYNHLTVNYHFDKRSWSVISQIYYTRDLLIGILLNLGCTLEKAKILDMEEECLRERIYKSLKGIRYFIVMDDVWDLNVWDDLRRCFPDDGNGSRILFTSRNKDAAPSNSPIHVLPSLSNVQCWELLQKKVFQNKPCPPQLLRIGRKIADSCQGLPLAVVVVAGILSTMDKEESTWKKVEGSLASHIFSDKSNSMMRTLELSYKHLPDHLKPCFLYFGAFPEDTAMSAKKLKHLWIAEGFVFKEENKSLETVAQEYLMELLDRSLVAVAKRRWDGGVKACVIHDLLHDLCLKIAEKEKFLKLINNTNLIYTNNHRLRINDGTACLPFGLHLRSLFLRVLHDSSPLNFIDKKLLIILDLPSEGLVYGDGSELLVHLRYLAIGFIEKMSSLDNLVNLEYLISASLLPKGIPTVIQKMVKLRHLEFPPGVGYLQNIKQSGIYFDGSN